MSEFMERHTVSKLIGSPPGYVGFQDGGRLTESIRKSPYTLILFDEIEKAHPDVFNIMLQVLEDGRLTDAKGRTVDFNSSIIILTSNVGARSIEKADSSVNYKEETLAVDSKYSYMKSLVNQELKRYFRPEFLNRLDDIIIFRQLARIQIEQISNIMLKELAS